MNTRGRPIQSVRNVLIVEDDHFKANHLQSLIDESLQHTKLRIVRSVHSAESEIRDGDFELILMDMSLPTYDGGTSELGGRPQPKGGLSLLGYMAYHNRTAPVIVVTQYERFEEEQLDLPMLNTRLQNEFPGFYRGLVHFDVTTETWKVDLRRLISQVVA